MSKNLKFMKELVILTFATLLVALSVFFFLMPSHASVSSIAGLAIVLQNFIPLSVSEITMVINVGLLLIGFAVFGKEFGFKTIYTSVLLPVFLKILEVAFPNNTSMTGDATLDVVCYVFLISAALTILFNMNASSGGLDIVAMLINRFFHVDIGRAMSFSGMVIALSSALVYDKKTVVLSLLGTYINGLVLDHFIFNKNVKRRVCILSINKEEEIRNWILHTLKSGATVYDAKGAYDGVVRNEIITIVDKNEYQKLMTYLAETDPEAFVTVYNVSNIRYVPKKH